MSHYDIYNNFLVEYDKMSEQSSYPSYTKIEACMMLNKAYLALIGQKLTGNNPRSIQFESDNKAIEDIRPLLNTKAVQPLLYESTYDVYPKNAILYKITDEDNLLYYIQSSVLITYKTTDNRMAETGNVEVKLVTHETAQKYMYTIHNKPWIESPVCYIEGDYIIVLKDERHSNCGNLFLTYIEKPSEFNKDSVSAQDKDDAHYKEFELSDTVAQELINLAIIMSAEVVESPRTASKLNLRPLES